MAETIVDDLLWENFHRAVNMTSRELREWLMVEGAGEDTEEVPEHAAPRSVTACWPSSGSAAPTSRARTSTICSASSTR